MIKLLVTSLAAPDFTVPDVYEIETERLDQAIAGIVHNSGLSAPEDQSVEGMLRHLTDTEEGDLVLSIANLTNGTSLYMYNR